MIDIEVVPVDAPSDDAVQRQRFTAAVAVHTAASRAVWGADHFGWTEQEFLGRRRGGAYTFVDRLAEVDGVGVGMAFLAMPIQDNPQLAMLMLAVHPDHRRVGIGTALVNDALALAESHGRTIVQVDTEWLDDSRDESGEGFAAKHGFTAAQTMIRSTLRLPADRSALQVYAEGDGVEDAAAFTIETAWDMPPPEWLDDLAVLQRRMSTDIPLGGMGLEEEAWDAARVSEDYRWAVDSGRRTLTTVARDLSTDRLIGFTVLQVTRHDPTLAYQQDTLVLREARGYRLGLRLKASATLELMDTRPEVTRVRTNNADDNLHMLAVNRDLGYRAEGYLRVWERRSAD